MGWAIFFTTMLVAGVTLVLRRRRRASHAALQAAVHAEHTFLELLLDLANITPLESQNLLLHRSLSADFGDEDPIELGDFDPRFTQHARDALRRLALSKSKRLALARIYQTVVELSDKHSEALPSVLRQRADTGLRLSRDMQRLFRPSHVGKVQKRIAKLPVHGMLKLGLKHFASSPAFSTSQIGHC